MAPKRQFRSAAVAEPAEPKLAIDLGKRKKVAVRMFNGMPLVDIREYYTKDDQDLPGKKGISLSAETWRALMDARDRVDAALADLEGAADPADPAASATGADTGADAEPAPKKPRA
ncbi:transcriptional Coactivator p15-domain-containing protein [Dipodascopsis tothii]|uniref:transcriptional Coactivator p15-domain-containing protein n=1 Tax=Dipodascopsis tothii TaxID=44089 RepID=UPI0034CF7408